MTPAPPFPAHLDQAVCRLAASLAAGEGGASLSGSALAATCRHAVLRAVAAHYGGSPPVPGPDLPADCLEWTQPPADLDAGEALGEAWQYLLARRLTRADGHYEYAPVRGSRRKTSGSYYTPPALIERLLATALDPLIAARADDAAALLRLRLLDPAAGVGHFLVAAARRLATAVASARGDGDPDAAMHAVLTHCIHGVDLDPTATALCRWTLARLTTQPVPALGTRIHCGNSLVGRGLDARCDAADADSWTRELAGTDMPDALHWHLAFPAVAASGGFDCIVGNPPWERAALEDVEYFTDRHDGVAASVTTASRQDAIHQLATDAPALHAAWQSARERQQAFTRFCQRSGRFPFGAMGRLNSYALFADLAVALCAPQGQWALILPSGIATDAPMAGFWRQLAEAHKVLALIDFENTDGLFPDVHHEQKFCILAASGAPRPAPATMRVGFWLRQADDTAAVYDLATDAFAAISPTTGQPAPVRSWRDLLLLRWIYGRVPPMWDHARDVGTARAWVAMTSSSWSRHYHTEPAPGRRPLLEAKLMHQYDPCYASYPDATDRRTPPERRRHQPGDRLDAPRPRFWMDAAEVDRFLAKRAAGRDWLLAYRDVTNVNNARTTIAAVLPATGLLQPLNGIAVADAATACRVLAVLNSFACDYVARQRFTGRHLNVTTVSQLPMPTAPWPLDPLARVAELSATLPALASFAAACGYTATPVAWDPDRRWLLRCELDAAVLQLYLGPAAAWPAAAPAELRAEFPTPLAAAAWILDSFSLVHRRETAAHGHPRSRDQILSLYADL